MFNSGNSNSEEDHLYDFNTNIDLGAVPGTSSGFNRAGQPNTSFRPIGTAAQRGAQQSSMGRNAPMSRGSQSRAGLMTGAPGGGSDARPMTSVSGAGYHGSSIGKDNKAFDPLNLGKGPAPPLAEKSDNSFEDKAKDMERKVHKLIEASAEAVVTKDYLKVLEKAKEAGKAERSLCKFRESHNLAEQINLDLTYAICFNLANAYYHNKMYEEALNTYQLIVKNKQYPQSGRLRVNMGNIYYEQKKYPQAIKMYRMALDQIPSTGKELRFRIFRNIGNAFVKLGQFQDAIESYETIMNGSPDIQTAFNLMLCLYARGDKDKMKKHFIKMLSIPIPGMTEEDEETKDEATDITVDRHDSLKEELSKKLKLSNEKILTAARLIAPVIDEKDDWEAGYKWIIEQLRSDYESVCSEFEIDLSMVYMKKRRFDDAIQVLKAFERKDAPLRAIAGTNLSFIYFLEGDYQQAEKQADIAMKSDRYNAKALVSKGNCLYAAGDFNQARSMYLEAVGVEADCVEAIYNLGLVNLKLNNLQEASSAFDKLHTSLSNLPEALYQLGSIYEKSGSMNAANAGGGAVPDYENAAKTYQLLLNKVTGDPNLCCKLGQLYEKMLDDNTACHWHTEAHRYHPVNLNVISWLGVWYVKREMYEQAIEYFERAALVQPGEVKWQLMVTSCYRRLGDFYKALELYQKIHEDHPDNIESLQYLEALAKELGRSSEEYTKKLEKLRRNQPAQMQNTNAGAMATRGAATGAVPQAPVKPVAAVERDSRPGNNTSSRPERSERPAPARQIEDFPAETAPNMGRSPLTAPRAGNAGRGGGASNQRANNRNDDDDDFGDTDVSSLLV